jgi:dihydrofolate reductase
MSLDGYIAGPQGELDWITTDPEINFTEIFSQFDTLLAGRRTFDTMVSAGQTSMPGMKIVVFSKTLRPADYPNSRSWPKICTQRYPWAKEFRCCLAPRNA